MWWKMYFWFFALLTVCALIGYGTYTRWTVRDFVDVATIVLGILGLYAYVYRKTLLTPNTWKWLLGISLTLTFVDIVYLYSGALPIPPYLLPTGLYDVKAWYIPCLMIGIPWYYAIYQLGFGHVPKKTKKK